MKAGTALTWTAILLLGGLSAWLGWWLGQRHQAADRGKRRQRQGEWLVHACLHQGLWGSNAAIGTLRPLACEW